MESITDIVVGLTNRRVKQLAEQMLEEIRETIASEMKHPERSTGAAANSFSISWNGAGGGGQFETGATGSFGGGFLTSVTISSDEPSAYYLDQGNGGSNRIIRSSRYPKGSLHLEHIGDVYAKQVHGYDGIHYIKKVADMHR